MKFLSIFLIITAAFFFLSCAKSEQVETGGEIVIEDNSRSGGGEEIVLDDRDFAGKSQVVSGSIPGRQERVIIAADNSKITTMYDGFGNKIEMRFFDNNPLLQSISIRTSAGGEKKVSVFGQNGSVRDLPAEMLERVLTASANDLAAAAGITEGRRETTSPMIVQTNQPLQPEPSYKFPVQTPVPQATQAETVETAEPETIETSKPPVEAIVVPTPKTEKLASKIPSGNFD